MRLDQPPTTKNSKLEWHQTPNPNLSHFTAEYRNKTLTIWQNIVGDPSTEKLALSTFKGTVDGKLIFDNTVHFIDAEHHLITAVDSEVVGASVPEENQARPPIISLNKNLKDLLPAIIEGAAMHDSNTGFGLGVHYLEDDQARLWRISTEESQGMLEGMLKIVPKTGRVVQLMREKDKKIIVSFRSFKHNEDTTYENGCMSYDVREINKIQLHVHEWLAKRMLPEPDGEFI